MREHSSTFCIPTAAGFRLMLALAVLSVGRCGAVESAEELLATAALLHQQRSYAAAAGKLEVFLKHYPSHAKLGPAALILGQCRLLAGSPDKALPAFRRALAASKDPRVTAPARLGEGEALARLGRGAEAVKALDAALSASLSTDQQGAGYYWLGEAHYRQRRYQDAAAAYEKSLQATPQGHLAPYAAYSAALCALQTGNRTEAIAGLRGLLKSFPQAEVAGEARLRLADALTAEGQTAEAEREYEQILKGSPNAKLKAEAEKGLIQSLLKAKRYAEAAPRLKSAAARTKPGSPEHAQTQLSLGIACYQTQRYAEAAQAYAAAAASKDPEVAAAALYGRARALEQLGKAPEALKVRRQLLARYPRSRQAAEARLAVEAAEAAAPLPKDEAGLLKRLAAARDSQLAARVRWALASLYLDQGKAAKAAEQAAAVAAQEGVPEDLKTAAALAEIEARLALKQFDQARSLASGLDREGAPPEVRAAAVHSMAWALEQMGKASEAAPLWERLSAEHPAAPQGREALFRLAEGAYEAEDYPAAVDHYRQFLTAASAPSGPEAGWAKLARLKLSHALYHQGQYEEALAGYRDFGARHAKDALAPEALFWEALSLEKLERRDEARKALERLVRTYPKHARAAPARARLAVSKSG